MGERFASNKSFNSERFHARSARHRHTPPGNRLSPGGDSLPKILSSAMPDAGMSRNSHTVIRSHGSRLARMAGNHRNPGKVGSVRTGHVEIILIPGAEWQGWNCATGAWPAIGRHAVRTPKSPSVSTAYKSARTFWGRPGTILRAGESGVCPAAAYPARRALKRFLSGGRNRTRMLTETEDRAGGFPPSPQPESGVSVMRRATI